MEDVLRSAQGGGEGEASAAVEATGAASNGAGPAPPLGSLPPIVICGDFNADPASSAVAVVAGHPLGMTSVGVGAAPDVFTTWKVRPSTGEKRVVIDYVWVRGLRLLRRWATPSASELGPTPLPTSDYPSDHLALCVDLEWPRS